MFHLQENPFVVLGVNPRSTKVDIHDAVEEALLDAEGVEAERRLNIARQALIAPNERLHAELSYLLEMRPAAARKALASQTFAEWYEVADGSFGLSQSNALVQAITSESQAKDVHTAFRRIFDSWTKIIESEVVARINEERAVAGFSKVRRSDVRNGLGELRAYHASQIVCALNRRGILANALAELLTHDLIPEDRMGEKFTSEVMNAYARQIGGVLANAADRAVESLKKYALSGEEADFERFEAQLEEWDTFAQPLQIAQEAKGADEAHSKELYEKIRETALDLANDEERHHEALQITKLSRSVFAELPWASEKLEEDAQALTNLIADKTRNEFLLPLASALKQAGEDLFRTSRYLSSHGFSSDAPDPIGALWYGYVNLLSDDVEQEVRDIGANMIRGLSIALFNKEQDSLQARKLTSQLAADSNWFSVDVVEQIAEDAKHLTSNLYLQNMTDAMKRGDWKYAKELFDELIQMSPASEVTDLQRIQQVIDQKLRAKKTSLVVWGSIAAVVLGLIVFHDRDSPSYDNDYAMADSAAPSDDLYSGTPAPTIGELVDVQEEQEGVDQEVAPPIYSTGSLSLPQLRYCLRQDERLEYARDMADGYAQQSRFNSAVSDFNSRCGSFRYDQSDMAKARAELAGIGGALASDAREIVGEAPSISPPSYTAPSSNPLGTVGNASPDVDDWDADDLDKAGPNNPYGETNEDYP